MKTKIIWTVLAVGLAGIAALTGWRNRVQNHTPVANVSVASATVDGTAGKQVIEVTAKEGYQPQEILAKADMPAVLKMKTEGTYDCSSTVIITSLNVRTTLPPTGETEIDIPAQKAGTRVVATCGMGMYSFEIKFD